MHRANVLVLGRDATPCIAKLQQHIIVYRHYDSLTYALVCVDLLAVDFCQLVGANDDGRSRCDFVLYPAIQGAHDVDEFAFHGIERIHLFGFGSRDPSGGVGAVVDVFQTVDVWTTIDIRAPPCVIWVLCQHTFDANF